MTLADLSDAELIEATKNLVDDVMAYCYHIVCHDCGAAFDSRSPNAKRCPECRWSETEYSRYHKKGCRPIKYKYMIEHDPCGDLNGLQLSKWDYRYMIQFGSLAHGTVIRDVITGKELKV